MDTKQITLGLVAILAIGGLAALGLYSYGPPGGQEATPPQEESTSLTAYNSSELGLSFEYPSNYTLETHEQDVVGRTWTTLVLIDSEVLREARENGASEGPPAIAVQVFENSEGYATEGWIQNTPYSNYQLSAEGVLMPAVVGGEEALAYRYSGLFETEAVVIARGNKVYMFSVDWLTPEDVHVPDFDRILETVTFL